jgi:hypothetical protein
MGQRDRLHRGSSWCPEQHGQLTHHLTTLLIGEDLPWQPWHIMAPKKGVPLWTQRFGFQSLDVFRIIFVSKLLSNIIFLG